MREKMSKHPPPAPTASAIRPCPTIIQISRTPRHWKFTQHLRTTRPPPRSVSSLSPFVIEKVMNGMAGEPSLVEYTNKKQIESLLRLKKFHDLKVQVSLHGSLNTCKGVVRCPDLKAVSEQEILEEMREQGVINVRRIKVRRDDALKDTNTFVFTFNTSVLPKQLKVAFLRVSVDPYIPNPLRYYACQVFGHHENKCHREEICANCGESKQSADETDCKHPPKCVNYKEE